MTRLFALLLLGSPLLAAGDGAPPPVWTVLPFVLLLSAIGRNTRSVAVDRGRSF